MPLEAVSVTGSTMGTTYHIKYIASENITRNEMEVKAIVDSDFSRINQLMSTYSDSSEVSRFNRFPANTWFPLSEDTYLVIALAQTISGMTQGSFDVTVAGLVDLWGFGPGNQTDKTPDPVEIKSLLQTVGYKQLQIKDEPLSVLKKANLRIDLSAIAKGYAVDVVSESLNNAGVESYLVELGGEVRAKGFKPGGAPWRIAIESPVVNKRAIQKVIQLHNNAVATSGDYRNYFESDGKRYSHTIDPTTGYPITHRLASVTVVDESTARADALATALMVMGGEEGLVFAEKNQIPALFIMKSDDGFEEALSSSFSDMMNKGAL
jgi:thiamine biosynthesis lipoprotein